VRSKRGRSVFIVFSIVIVVVLIILLGNEIFGVHSITVTGLEKFSDEEIIKLSGIIPGENIFKLDIQKVKDNLLSNPYISVEKVERKLPDTILIGIHERKPSAVIEYMGSYITLDIEGYILDIQKRLGEDRYPIVRGMKVNSFLIGQRMQSSDPYQVKVLGEILAQVYGHDAANMLSEINIEDPMNVYFISREGLKVKIGQTTDIAKKIIWMKEVVPELQKEGKTSGVLDITTGTCASYKVDETIPEEEEVTSEDSSN